MKTAIDTNIISALWSGEPASAIVSQTLNEALLEGALTICGHVYAELLAHPKVKASFVDEFLAPGRIAVDCAVDAAIWREAWRSPDIPEGTDGRAQASPSVYWSITSLGRMPDAEG